MFKSEKELPIIEGIKVTEEDYTSGNLEMEGRKGDQYFRPKPFERSGKLYKFLGVRQYKRLWLEAYRIYRKIKHTENSKPYYQIGERTVKGLKDFENRTRTLERMHLTLIPFSYSILYSTGFSTSSLIDMTITNIFVSFYPIILQRYNRARIYNTIEQAKEGFESVPLISEINETQDEMPIIA